MCSESTRVSRWSRRWGGNARCSTTTPACRGCDRRRICEIWKAPCIIRGRACLRVTYRRRYDPTRAAILMLGAIRAAQPDSLRFDDARFDRLAGGSELRRATVAGSVGEAVWGSWNGRLARFQRLRAKYLLY